MSERIPENDFHEVAQDMPPETNADVSRGHLLRWAMDHHLVHFDEAGHMVVDGSDDLEEDTSTPEDLQAFQERLSLLEAGDQKTFSSNLPEAS